MFSSHTCFFRAFTLCFASTLFIFRALHSAEPDVVVYGATPAGIAAALAAAKDDKSVLLIEPTARIGGLVTSGLSHTDIRTFEALNGTFLEFSRRVESYYKTQYGPNSSQVQACERGIFGEPKVNLLVFTRMLVEQPKIKLLLSTRLLGVIVDASDTEISNIQPNDLTTRIKSIAVMGSEGGEKEIYADMYIDATYEGDLMAAAGVPYRTGREGRDEYGESLAPAKPDKQLQAYNFRFIMTRNPNNRVTPVAPQGYNRKDFLPVLAILDSGKIKQVFDYPSRCLFKAHEPALPNQKYDINDVSGGIVRLSLPGVNLGWPDGNLKARQAIFNEHLRDQVGLLYFLQNDPEVPQKFQQQAREWGWCRDEFVETEHLPPQLYVREARRMIGRYVFTERDTEHAPGDARSVLHRDAIAMGDYGPNCHGTFHEGPRFGGKHTGEFYKRVVPYQIPYGVLLPKNMDNLFVPVATSASHVGFCALRLEPIWTSLGQAAGHAAALALDQQSNASRVPVDRLQQRLHQEGLATMYVSDVPPENSDFAAVQWWGLQGGWHGLAPEPDTPGQRGKNLHGQYFAAFPNHQADLDEMLDEETLSKWEPIVARLQLDSPIQTDSETDSPADADQSMTRGEYLRHIWKQISSVDSGY